MTPEPDLPTNDIRLAANRILQKGALALPLLIAVDAQAAMFQGEALDTVADVMSWIVLVVVPVVVIAVFWLVHILPEKIAEKKQHPQAKAIQTLCLLSLFFGGILWPLAWLWAYSKPVLYKMAYGTDKVAHGHEDEHDVEALQPENAEEIELRQLRKRIVELEASLTGKSTPNIEKA